MSKKQRPQRFVQVVNSGICKILSRQNLCTALATLLVLNVLGTLLPVSASPIAPARPTGGASAGSSAGFATGSTAATGVASSASSSTNVLLDLTSTAASTTAASISGFRPVNIVSGATQMAVRSDTILTPAQFAAVQQVLTSGRQFLNLASGGNAVGGSLSIGGNFTNLAGLVVPQGVSVLETITAPTHTLNFTGGLQNAGLLSFTNSFAGMAAARINATTIENLATGVISAGSNINLTLAASQSLTNQGLITAARDISVISPVVTNVGSIQSDSGNINITGQNGSLLLNGTNGTVQANNGNINIGVLNPSASTNILLSGNSFLSQQLNIDAARGTIRAAVQDVTGIVNITAHNNTFGASTPKLEFGLLNVDGDPTYYNKAGSVIINTQSLIPATGGFDMAFIASGDVVIKGTSPLLLSTSNPSGNGGNLLIIAGANVSAATSGQVNNTQAPFDTITVTQSSNPGGGSVTGGAIDLSGVSAIDTTSAGGNGNGGNVTMLAYTGTGTGSTRTPGTINLGSTLVKAWGNDNGSGGNITLIAGANSNPIGSNAINGSGQLNTGGFLSGNVSTGSLVGGNVTATTANPIISGTMSITNGVATGATISADSVIKPTSIALGNIETSPFSPVTTQDGAGAPTQPNAGNVTITSGGTLTTGSIAALGNFGLFNNVGPAGTGGNGGAVTLRAAGNITTQDISTVSIFGGLGATGSGGAGGNGGAISLYSSGGNITVQPTNLVAFNADGGSGSGGNGFGQAGGNGGNGGNVFVYAPKGAVKIGSILTNGGGGGGGDGGGGKGGDGGSAGNVTISGQTVAINGFIAASGGGGGGGGSTDSTGFGGAGGGGSSVKFGGLGGSSSTGTGAGGGGGGLKPGFGGTSNGNQPDHSTRNPSTLTGETGATSNTVTGPFGGVGGDYSIGGAGGQGSIPGTNDGGTGGGIAQNGSVSQDGLAAGGLGGNGGQVSLSGNTVSVTGTLYSFYKNVSPYSTNASLATVPHFNDSVLALGNGGQLTVDTGTSTVTSQAFPAALNLASTTANLTAAMSTSGTGFAVKGGAFTTNGTLGNIETNTTNSINAASAAALINTATTFNPTGKIVVNQGDAPVVIRQSAAITPAVAVALIQASSFTGQTLVLNGNAATGGTFTLAANNIPTGGFSTFLIPANVSGSASTNFNVSGTATVNGNLSFSSGGVLTAGTITGSGLISSPLVALRLVSTAGDIAQAGNTDLNISANTVSISSTGNVYLNNVLSGTATALTLNASNASFFSLKNDKTINLAGTISAPAGIALATLTGNSSINLNASLISTGSGVVTLAAGGSGSITQSNSSAIVASSLSATAALGSVTLGQGTNTLSTNNLTLNALNANVTALSPISLGASTVGTFSLSAPAITTGGNSTFGSATIATNSLTINHNLSATTGTINIQAMGNDLTLAGSGLVTTATPFTVSSATGSIAVPAGTSLSFSSTTGTNQFNAPFGSVALASSATINVNGNAALTSAAGAFNFNNIVPTGTYTVTLTPNGGPSLGTYTSAGDLVLTSNMVLNSSGKNLVLIASGNITASGVPTINLSSPTGPGGSLYVLAGVNFSTANTSANTVLSVLAPSATGGSINFSGVSLNTSSTGSASSAHGGAVYLIAESGSTNLGQIFTGSITTSSLNGRGGDLRVIASGGAVINGAVNTSGKTAGGQVQLYGANASFTNFDLSTAVPLMFGSSGNSGFLSPLAIVTPGSPVAGSGAAITVGGTVTTSSTNGPAGLIDVETESNLRINGAITAKGFPGGNTTLLSTGGNVYTTGGIDLSGNTTFALPTSFANGGSGGNLVIGASGFITVGGIISTAGGVANGPGNGGAGGSVNLATSASDSSNGKFTGAITVAGSINTTGGNTAFAPIPNTLGGIGGNASLVAGTVQVTQLGFANGSSGSIITSGGSGQFTTGAGSVLIKTYSVQNIPSNFNLTSTTLSETALPGGIFNVGNSAINGTLGSIVAGTNVANSTNANAVTGSQSFGNVQFTIDTTSATISSVTIAPRDKITPGQALAAFQVSRGQTQTVALNAQKQVVANGVNPSILTIPAYDVPQSFSSFVLAAADVPAQVKLSITGLNPVLNLGTTTATLRGEIEFATASSNALLISSLPQTIQAGAKLTAMGSLALQLAGTLTNAGTVTATNAVIAATPIGVFGIQNTGSFTAASLIMPSNALPIIATVGDTSFGQFSPAIMFQPQQLPTALGSLASSFAPGSTGATTTTLNLNFTGNTNASVGGAVSGIFGLTINATGGNILNVLSSSNFATTQTLSISTAGALAFANNTALNSGSITLRAGSLSTVNTSSFQAVNSLMVTATTGNLTSEVNDTFSVTNGTLMMTANAGSIALKGTTISARGATISATAGSVSLGTNLQACSITASAGQVSISGAAGIAVTNSTLSGSTGIALNSLNGSITELAGPASQYSSSSGTAMLTAKIGVTLLPGSQVNGKFGVTISASDATSGSLTIGETGAQASIGSTSGSVTLSAPTGITVKNTSMSGQTGLMITATSGAFTDNGGSSVYNSAAGITVTASKGITFGAGANVTAASTISLTSIGVTTGISFDGSGGATQVISTNGTLNAITTNSYTLNSATVSAKMGVTLTSLQGGVTDNNGSTISSSSAGITLNAKTTVSLSQGAVGSTLSAATNLMVTASSGSLVLGGNGLLNITAGTTASFTGGTSISTANALIKANGVTLMSSGGWTDAGSTTFTFNTPSTTANFSATASSIALGNGSKIDFAGNVTLGVSGLVGTMTLGAGGTAVQIDGRAVSFTAPGNITANNVSVGFGATGAGSINVSSTNGQVIWSSGGLQALTSSATTVSVSGTSVNLGTSTVAANTGLTVTASTGSVTGGTSYVTNAGALKITAKQSIDLSNTATLTAGTLGTAIVGTGIQASTVIGKAGTIAITAGGFGVSGQSIKFASNALYQSFGAFNVTMTGGDIILGSSSTFQTVGGNLVMLASGNVTGGTGQIITSLGVGNTTATTGGGIELGAGTTTSQLLAAASQPSNATGRLGTGVTINSAPNGVARVNAPSLVNAVLDNSTLTFNTGGGIVFDFSATNNINLQGTTFTVSAARPVAYRYGVAPITKTELDLDEASSSEKLAHVLAPGEQRLRALQATEEELSSAKGTCKSRAKNIALRLRSGELFINPLVDTIVNSDFGTISIAKGAIACISQTADNCLRISACSGPGHVTVQVAHQSVMLNPGQEMTISSQALPESEQLNSDGVGRRAFENFVFNSGKEKLYITRCQFSLVSLLGNKTYLDALRHPVSAEEKILAGRLMKTAVVLQQVGGGGMPYRTHTTTR